MTWSSSPNAPRAGVEGRFPGRRSRRWPIQQIHLAVAADRGAGATQWLAEATFRWTYLDAAWVQYNTRQGDLRIYLTAQIDKAKSEGLGLVAGLNVMHGAGLDSPSMTASSDQGPRHDHGQERFGLRHDGLEARRGLPEPDWNPGSIRLSGQGCENSSPGSLRSGLSRSARQFA